MSKNKIILFSILAVVITAVFLIFLIYPYVIMPRMTYIIMKTDYSDFVWYPIVKNELVIESFILSDYDTFIQEYEPSEQLDSGNDTVNEIVDAGNAIQWAVINWKHFLGNKALYGRRPLNVYYDEEEEIWLVVGSLPKGVMEEDVPYILIDKSDGSVLAVWHDE